MYHNIQAEIMNLPKIRYKIKENYITEEYVINNNNESAA